MEYKFDIDELKKQVKKVIKSSQGFDNINLQIDNLIEDWLEAKKNFIEKMDGNLIYMSNQLVSFELDSKLKDERIENFADLIFHHYSNELLSHFICLLSVDDFYNNLTSQEYMCGDIIVPKNFKVIKAFKFFVDNPDILKDIQNEASRIIQENTIKGYLCFSVHPLDFLSASENIHNWRSCHALDGDYRTGNLNYLMDSTTVICYLAAKEQAILPHFPEDVPWNSKKWRVWAYFSNDRSMMFLGRQYPFSSDIGIEFLRKKILPTVGLGRWLPYNQTKFSGFTDERSNTFFAFSKMVPVGRGLIKLSELVQDGDNTFMYNDILKSSCYDALYSYKEVDSSWFPPKTGYSTSNTTRFIIGKSCKCPICGKNDIDYSDVMSCEPCAETYSLKNMEDFYICDLCGEYVHSDDAIFLPFSDICVCPACFNSRTSSCDHCGVSDLDNYITYYNGSYLCDDCLETEKRRNIKKICLEGEIIYGS